MQRGRLIRSRGFCPAESFVCSGYPAFDRRGAHPAWSLAACFNPPALRQRCALGSLLPKTVERAPRVTDFRPARFHRRFHLADELLMIRYCRHYLFAIRLLLDASSTL